MTPQSLAGRTVYITAYLCAVVLLAGYGGNYISFLTAGRPLVLPFTSFEGILKDGTYQVGAIHKSAQVDIFRVIISYYWLLFLSLRHGASPGLRIGE